MCSDKPPNVHEALSLVMTRLTGTPRKIILTPSPKTILYLTYFIGLWIISIGCGSGVEDKVNTLFWIMQINFTEKDLTV